jgi:hypothetical protein
MKRFKVRWVFAEGLEMARTSFVLARDKRHAKERIWMNHVEPSQLRHKIRFISVEETDEEPPQENAPAT